MTGKWQVASNLFWTTNIFKNIQKVTNPCTKSSMCASLCVPAPCRDAATAGITARLNHGTGAPGLRLMWSQRVIETKTNRSKTDRTKSYAPKKTIHSALARNVNDSCGDLRSVCFNGWMDTLHIWSAKVAISDPRNAFQNRRRIFPEQLVNVWKTNVKLDSVLVGCGWDSHGGAGPGSLSDIAQHTPMSKKLSQKSGFIHAELLETSGQVLTYPRCLCLLVSCLDFSQLKLRTYPKNKAG